MTSSFFSFFPLPSPSAFYEQNTLFSDNLTTPCEGEIDGFVAWGSELENTLENKIDAVELDDLENDEITEEETK